MTLNYTERNYDILKDSMIEHMEDSLKLGGKIIDSELDAGLLNIIVKPIVNSFYKHWVTNDVREGIISQINITLDLAKLMINGNKSNIEEITEKNFPIYLAGDQTSRNCKKTHRNYKKLVEITRESFISQIKESISFLSVDKEDIKTYDDLTRAVFKNKEDALKALMTQLDFNEESIKIVEQDPTILSVPTGKNIIVKTLIKGFKVKKKELLAHLEEVYN